jgi:hypothetical protein
MDDLDILTAQMEKVNGGLAPMVKLLQDAGIPATYTGGDIQQDAEIDLGKKGDIEYYIQVGDGYEILQSFDGTQIKELAEGWAEILKFLKSKEFCG